MTSPDSPAPEPTPTGATAAPDSRPPPAGSPDSPPPVAGAPLPDRRRQRMFQILGVVALFVALFEGVPWLRTALSTVSTDDAFVNGHVTFVAARVPGQVTRVLVDDNNRVRGGDMLVQLDKEP